MIQFRFEVGNGLQTLEQETSYPMNDDEWHTVHIERNRKQAMLRVSSYMQIICMHSRYVRCDVLSCWRLLRLFCCDLFYACCCL